VRVDKWEIKSRYPVGHFVRKLGPLKELETNISALLVEHNLQVEPFTEEMTSHLPPLSQVKKWKVDPQEAFDQTPFFTHLLTFLFTFRKK